MKWNATPTALLSDSPNSREYPFEVASEDQFDVGIAVLAANQTFGKVKHALRMIEALDIDFFAESIAALVAGAQLLVFLRRHAIVTLQIGIAANTDMFDADKLCDVVKMIQGVLDGGGLVGLDEHTHPGDAHDSAGCRHFLDGFIGLAARMRNEGTAIGMRDEHRFLGDFERFQGGAIAAMRSINDHTQFVHSPDDGDSKIADAVVAALGGAVSNQVARIVGELRNALAQTEEGIDIVWTAEMLGVLQAEEHANLAGLVQFIEGSRAVDAH